METDEGASSHLNSDNSLFGATALGVGMIIGSGIFAAGQKSHDSGFLSFRDDVTNSFR